MSVNLYLFDKKTGEPCILPEEHDMKGAIYAVGGTDIAEFSITYNYNGILHRAFGEPKTERFGPLGILQGKTGAESLPLLSMACLGLADDVSDDYWEATEGNAKHALMALIKLAEQCPEGVWELSG